MRPSPPAVRQRALFGSISRKLSPQGPVGPAGTDGADGATVHLGQWQEVDVSPTDTKYVSEPVTTDGFVTAFCVSDESLRAEIAGFEVLDDSREILMMVSKCPASSSFESYAGITMPVRKGNQYRINWLCNRDVSIKWWPLTA
jgi:hypothetical protein